MYSPTNIPFGITPSSLKTPCSCAEYPKADTVPQDVVKNVGHQHLSRRVAFLNNFVDQIGFGRIRYVSNGDYRAVQFVHVGGDDLFLPAIWVLQEAIVASCNELQFVSAHL